MSNDEIVDQVLDIIIGALQQVRNGEKPNAPKPLKCSHPGWEEIDLGSDTVMCVECGQRAKKTDLKDV